jgi:hypothetical protein
MSKKIVFTITDQGMVIDSNGFTGLTCLTELEKLQEFLLKEGGIKTNITDQKKKIAVYAPEVKQKGSEVKK